MYTPSRDRRSINGKGWPGTQEAEAGDPEDDSRRTLGKGNGGLDPLTEEEVSDARAGWFERRATRLCGEDGAEAVVACPPSRRLPRRPGRGFGVVVASHKGQIGVSGLARPV